MSRLQIPYDRVLINPTDFEAQAFDLKVKQLLEASCRTPVVVELFNDYIQYLLFMNDGQFYWAGVRSPGGFDCISIREFFSRLRRTQFPKFIAYEINLLLYHSLLVFLQNKPDLKVSSNLVNLDELLERSEKEHSNSLITAFQPRNLIMLRYKDDHAVSCYHGMTNRTKGNLDKREEFLVKIYTMTAHSVFEINLFTNLVVTHSEDARHLPQDYCGSLESYFMSNPPKLIVRLKNRPLKTYTFTGKQLTIGRLPDNDIVIDNLSVSRKHAVIHAWKSGYHIKDLDSKNHTYLNGQKVDSGELNTGDMITIGKYQIHFQIPASDEIQNDNLDQTMIIPGFHSSGQSNGTEISQAREESPPKLFRRSDQEEFTLDSDRTVIGKGSDSNIRLSGIFSPRVTAEIKKCESDFIIRKTSGRKDISINGERMTEKILEEEDLILIGSEEFVFKR
ncbi:MAG: FHA domain-containing protein [Candidatus Krumholzibacteriota bacterium]|nr:FHA domain-containing protein [Candidatus Krumholzibacteriota bacterium]